MKKVLFAFVGSLLILSSCAPNSNEGGEQATEDATETGKSCAYVFNPDSTTFTWTAYKFTDRVGVSGTFTELIVDGFEESDDIGWAVNGASFKIPVTSVESNDEDRNKKIAKYFFESINTPVIYGSIVGLKGEPSQGVAEIKIVMNNTEVPVFFPYTFENGVLNMSTSIDVSEWGGEKGITLLNEVCYDLHKGADGVSKLWPDVKIEINAVFDQRCD